MAEVAPSETPLPEAVPEMIADKPEETPVAAVDESPIGTERQSGSAQPERLSEARGGQADDLKQIKGVGPKLEILLNSLGFFHFDQVAAWSDDEAAWVDDNLQGFKGRVTREEWVSQAKILAGGGETEFSKKVEDGDVY